MGRETADETDGLLDFFQLFSVMLQTQVPSPRNRDTRPVECEIKLKIQPPPHSLSPTEFAKTSTDMTAMETWIADKLDKGIIQESPAQLYTPHFVVWETSH